MFNRKYKEIIAQQKAMMAEVEVQVTQQNELYRAVYELLSTGMALGKDSKMKDYIKEGYEGNPDLFSIVTKLAGMFAQVMIDTKLMQRKGEKYIEVDNDEIDALFENANYYQNFFEFCRHWAISYYITGNAITYAPRLSAGLNQGKLTKDGMIIMPTQNIDILPLSWRQPIGFYTLDMNQTYKIDVKDVWHERFAPTLNYEGGKNFMGMSPVKVVQNIINSQNAGYEVTAKMYQNGHPPGILSKEVEGGGETLVSQESKFRERWLTKYVNKSSSKIPEVPVFTIGKMTYTKIGYDNLEELQVISMSEHGRRIFCNVLQCPAQLFNDAAASTYNNMIEAEKAIYTHRIIPDVSQFLAGFNNIIKAYGDFYLKADYSEINCLQEEKAKKVLWVSQLYKDGVITGDGYLERLGEEPTGLPDMQIRYVDANRLPTDFLEGGDVGKNNEWYRNHGISDYKSKKHIVKCSHCKNEFDYLSVSEAGMGYVFCPKCGKTVTQ